MLNRVTLALARAVARPASRSAFASSRSLGPASLISLSRTSSGPVRSATTTTKTGSASARKAATSATAAAARKASGMKAGAGRPKKKTKAKKKAAPKKRKVVRAKKPPPPPKRTQLTYPSGKVNAYSIFISDSLKGQISTLSEAQTGLKAGADQWKNLSATDKLRYAAEAEKLNKQKDAAWAAWKAALTPDQISRERKVQAYRRSQGLKIPTASRYATRRTISAGAATKKSPFITFYKGLYDQPGAGERVCGPAWNTASASEKGKLAGQAWKGLSNAEKESYR